MSLNDEFSLGHVANALLGENSKDSVESFVVSTLLLTKSLDVLMCQLGRKGIFPLMEQGGSLQAGEVPSPGPKFVLS